MLEQPLELYVYTKEPNEKGYLTFLRRRTYQEIFDHLIATLGPEMLDRMDYFSLPCGLGRYGSRPDKRDSQIPEFRWVACYAVTGDNEGHYIHIDLVTLGDGPNDPPWITQLAVGKTFSGMELAQRVACICAEALDA